MSLPYPTLIPGLRRPFVQVKGIVYFGRYEGFFGPWLARWVGSLNDRYLAMEANGLKARCAELASQSNSSTP